MSLRILTTRISGASLVSLRERTRQIGDLFGLEKLQRTRFVTAVSEIARNTVQYAGEGTATFLFDPEPCPGSGQHLVVEVIDKGPGIADVVGALAGTLVREAKVPLGICGSRRLVDQLTIDCPPSGGTRVTIAMCLAKHAPMLTGPDIAALVERLARRKPQTPMEELELQNRDMLFALDELRQKQLELQLADERKNQFLSTLAHELRNPLGTLQMTLAVICRKAGMTQEELTRRCGVMTRQTEQLGRLVDDLMDVSRVTHGKVDLHKEPVEVNQMVSQAAEMCSAATQERGHQVDMALCDSELWIHADTGRMKQVLCNLIQNAARYTPPGGRISITVRLETPYAVVEVADNGMGIAPDMLPQIFGLFVQGHPDDASKGGLGVGLTLVQRLTEDHGGTVSASSAGLGLGSCFTVTLPLSAAPAALH